MIDSGCGASPVTGGVSRVNNNSVVVAATSCIDLQNCHLIQHSLRVRIQYIYQLLPAAKVGTLALVSDLYIYIYIYI